MVSRSNSVKARKSEAADDSIECTIKSEATDDSIECTMNTNSFIDWD
jgi:hypothetical protein